MKCRLNFFHTNEDDRTVKISSLPENSPATPLMLVFCYSDETLLKMAHDYKVCCKHVISPLIPNVDGFQGIEASITIAREFLSDFDKAWDFHTNGATQLKDSVVPQSNLVIKRRVKVIDWDQHFGYVTMREFAMFEALRESMVLAGEALQLLGYDLNGGKK